MSRNPENIIAVALSGGIDSLVSAFLLKEQGLNIFGLHFITGYETTSSPLPAHSRIEHLSELLDIKIHVIDIREKFEKYVVNYFVDTYLSGSTPNPCMVCNREIKFGIMLDEALKRDAARLATGHYARTESGGTGNYCVLKKGMDVEKDQSYFLAMLKPHQLEKAYFVLGEKTKTEVRRIAAENDLHPVITKESQDICFIRNKTCQDFLLSRLHRKFENGDIVNTKGELLGRHQGLFRYTIGQRRGINCPASFPYYVLGLDVEQNRLIVGFKDELFQNNCFISDVNWLIPKPQAPIHVETRIRYRHQAVESVLTPSAGDSATIHFNNPQHAITPGQVAVCYQGESIVAGGWIT